MEDAPAAAGPELDPEVEQEVEGEAAEAAEAPEMDTQLEDDVRAVRKEALAEASRTQYAGHQSRLLSSLYTANRELLSDAFIAKVQARVGPTGVLTIKTARDLIGDGGDRDPSEFPLKRGVFHTMHFQVYLNTLRNRNDQRLSSSALATIVFITVLLLASVAACARPPVPEPVFQEYRIESFDEKVNLTQDPDTGIITLRLCNIFVGPRNTGDPTFRIELFSVSYLINTATLNVDVDFNACLEVYLDPCTEAAGIRFAFRDDLRLSPNVDLGSGFKVIDLYTFTIDLPDAALKEWTLPPVLDDYHPPLSMCANITIKFLPLIRLCYTMSEFKISYGGFSFCPTVTLHVGDVDLLKIDYHDITGGSCPGALPASPTCQCPIGLGFNGECRLNGSVVNATTVSAFKSFDADHDQLISANEWKAGMARFNGPSDAEDMTTFNLMDENTDGFVHYTEFQTVTEANKQAYVDSLNGLQPWVVAVIVIACLALVGVPAGVLLWKRPAVRRRLAAKLRLPARRHADPMQYGRMPAPGRVGRM